MTEQPEQTGQQQQQAPPSWYTDPPAWLRTPPPTQQPTQQHSSGNPDLVGEIQAMPERVVRALQDAITAATQQQNSGQQQQNSGQQQQDSGQHTEQQRQQPSDSGQQQDTRPGGSKGFADWWFSTT